LYTLSFPHLENPALPHINQYKNQSGDHLKQTKQKG